MWAIIAEAIVAMMNHAAVASQPRAEPRLDDVLEGSVTKAVIDADGVKRDELDSIIAEVSKKLHDD